MGDIQSSDPYCILKIGPKIIDKTAVRTWTLNPTWNEHFIVPLLHLKHRLIIEIWDHDKVGSDDILGKVELDLSELPTNAEVVKKMSLEKASESIKPRGVLDFTIILEVKWHIVIMSVALTEPIISNSLSIIFVTLFCLRSGKRLSYQWRKGWKRESISQLQRPGFPSKLWS